MELCGLAGGNARQLRLKSDNCFVWWKSSARSSLTGPTVHGPMDPWSGPLSLDQYHGLMARSNVTGCLSSSLDPPETDTRM